MALLAQSAQRYVHCPRLTTSSAGLVELSVIAWEGAAERVLRCAVGAHGELTSERSEPAQGRIVTLTRGEQAEACDTERAEREERRGGLRVSVAYTGAASEVWLERADGQRVLVWRGQGCAAAPTLAVTADGGAWVAFHHDLREDTGRADVAKWIALVFVTASGELFAPAAPMTDRDRDRQGVEQSFEFPALACGPDGALALFGRGSHNFWRQDLNAAGFGPRVALSDGEWGSRGRHIVAVSRGSSVIVARRDRRGIEVSELAAPTGGSPRLVPMAAPGEAAAVAARSRPDDPARAHGLVTLFGDIQQHSAHSDGLGSAHEVYQRARHRYGDDFVALTDHESFLGKRTGPGEWEYLQQVADHFDEPGAFAALYAYEWTGKAYPGPGHKCVYYRQRGLPIISRDEVPVGKDLVARVRALAGFASPHHIGWTGADEAGHDELGQPLWEICSCHGCYEHAGHPLGARGELRDQLVDVMLKKGHRFGFTASSDSHGLLYHHGEARKRDAYRTGLTAVQATACERGAILDALVQRRCYATSGAKIWLDVTADGAPMGSLLETARAAHIQVRAVGEAEVLRVELVSEAGVLARAPGHGRRAELSAQAAGRYVYARVIQSDGEMAWSSPVFFGPRP